MPLPDAEALCAKLVAELKPHIKPTTAMIGLYTGGAWLAQKLHPQLGLSTPLGLMDIAFYRDDYHKQGLHHDPKRTEIAFEVEGRDLRTLGREQERGRTADAARRAGHERALAGDGAQGMRYAHRAVPPVPRPPPSPESPAKSALTSSPTERSISGSSVSELVTATVQARRGASPRATSCPA